MPKLSEAGKLALNELIENAVKDGKLHGLALAITNVDEQIYAKAAGNLVPGDPTSPPVTNDSVFWIASMTKLIANMAALQLIERGVFSFSTPISTFLPDFANPIVLIDPYTTEDPTYVPAKEEITVLHLMTHSSGVFYGRSLDMDPEKAHLLPEAYILEYSEEQAKKIEQFVQVLKGHGKYDKVPLVFEPGSAFCYGYSSDVLGLVIEQAAGMSLGEFTQKNIFSPLGISNSFNLNVDTNERLVQLAFRNKEGKLEGWNARAPLMPRYPKPMPMHLGGAGSYSTLPDYLTLLRHLMQIEAGRDVPNPILSRTTVHSLFEPKLSPVGAFALTAFLQMVVPMVKFEEGSLNWSTGMAFTTKNWEPGRRKAGTGFWSGWAGTWFFVDPKTGVALAFGSPVVPPMDRFATELVDKAECILYGNLEE